VGAIAAADSERPVLRKRRREAPGRETDLAIRMTPGDVVVLRRRC